MVLAPISSICVYCGSRSGNKPAYRALADALGTLLGSRRIRLVFGGGRVGLMGAAADAALAAGGDVVGVIPERLYAAEVGHGGLGKLHVVDSMHTRKAKMFDLSDGFVVLPGGIGTLDELVEILTWRQLGLHTKPVVLVGAAYWQPLVALLDHMKAEGFSYGGIQDMYTIVDDVDKILPALEAAPETTAPAPLDIL